MAAEYPPGFLDAWERYPHHGQRSRKALALKVWKYRNIERHRDNVPFWIEAYERCDDWQKDGGAYIPGMQVWLRGIDFSEKPALGQTAFDPPRQKTNRVLTEEEKRRGLEEIRAIARANKGQDR